MPTMGERVDAPSGEKTVDHMVVGSGLAGLMLALKLACRDRVLVIAKATVRDNNTWHAQGGIASVLDEHDSFDSHVEDTVAAGAGLCHRNVVESIVRAGPRLVGELVELGVQFTRGQTSGDYHLTREGGHSARRVIHADDVTGREVLRALIEKVRGHPNIELRENAVAVDLVTTDKYAPVFSRNRCLGAYVLERTSGTIEAIRSRNTYLCTGGHGRVYLYTSNPDAATGDGLAMAWRAGCRVANLEFMQFHPTCLFHPQAKTFLISEALRGEGAVLRDKNESPFMQNYHEMASLAPRDVVARAIDMELKKSGATNVYLDARGLGPGRLRRFFPNIYKTCLRFGIDITEQMIPVVPAAHYSCGGIVVDESGQTDIENLYALGEVACTGLHGANRLASNSLLEALGYADIVAERVLDRPPQDEEPTAHLPPWDSGGAVAPADELVVLSHSWDEIRRLMWHYVGIVRSTSRLKRALRRIVAIQEELDTFYWQYQVTEEVLEVRNLATVAYLTIRSAMARKESRGIHYMLDYPHPTELGKKDTIIR